MLIMTLPILATFPNGRGQQTPALRDLSPVFINKVLLELRHARSFTNCVELLPLGRVE